VQPSELQVVSEIRQLAGRAPCFVEQLMLRLEVGAGTGILSTVVEFRNEDLWRDGSPTVPVDSALRTAGFWWDHYGLGGVHDPAPGRDGWPARSVMTESVHTLFFALDLPVVLHVRTGAHGAELDLATGDRRFNLAYHDDAHPMPQCLRWVEAEAIARHVEEAGDYPSGPRLALLLLAPFTAVTTPHEADEVTGLLRGELEALNLLDGDLLDAAAGWPCGWLRLAQSDLLPNKKPVGWVRDDTVGWRLEGTWGQDDLFSLSHTLRWPDSEFPADEFLRLLRHVGVADLGA
jgi:hypothetical protein